MVIDRLTAAFSPVNAALAVICVAGDVPSTCTTEALPVTVSPGFTSVTNVISWRVASSPIANEGMVHVALFSTQLVPSLGVTVPSFRLAAGRLTVTSTPVASALPLLDTVTI